MKKLIAIYLLGVMMLAVGFGIFMYKVVLRDSTDEMKKHAIEKVVYKTPDCTGADKTWATVVHSNKKDKAVYKVSCSWKDKSTYSVDVYCERYALFLVDCRSR